MANKDGTWLSINDYSRLKKISISTIRRRIKAEHLKYRLNDGKYEIFTTVNVQEIKSGNDTKILALTEENKRLNKIIEEQTEKMHELEMLVILYEKKVELPPLPKEEFYS